MNFDKVFNILVEKIQITLTNFGSKKPFTDGHFNKADGYIYTFFEHEGEVIVVSFDDNKSLNFGIIKNGESIMSHEESNINFKQMQSLYGKILFVFEKMVNQFNIKTFIVYSSPFEPQVKKLYDNFAKNSNIQSLLKSIGFNHYKLEDIEEYDGTKFKVHQFSKIKYQK